MISMRYVYSNPDEGALPEALAVPWTKSGSATPALAADGWTLDMSAGDDLNYSISANPSDRSDSDPRGPDLMELQIEVQGVTQDDDGAIGFWIDDGQRAVGVAIGDALRLVDPGDYSATLATAIDSGFPWTGSNVYRLVKWQTQHWGLYVNGDLVIEIPYLLGVASAGAPARFWWGKLDTAGSQAAKAIFRWVEAARGIPLADQAAVVHAYHELPQAMREAWTRESRAVLRAALHAMSRAPRASRELLRAQTAAVMLQPEAEYLFWEVEPENADTPWSVGAPTGTYLVNDRVRFDPVITGGTLVHAVVWWPTAFDAQAIMSIGIQDLRLISGTTVGTNNGVGPCLEMAIGTRDVWACLFRPAADEFYWQIANGPANPVGPKVRVDPYVPHDVSLVTLGDDAVYLLINKRVAARARLADFSSGGGIYYSRIGMTSTGTNYIWEVRGGFTRVQLSDQSRRPWLEQAALERLIAIGGCERPDEIDLLAKRHFEVQEGRGAAAGIMLELPRLACSGHVYIMGELKDAGWVLDETYPEETPIYLDLEGEFRRAYVEFEHRAPNFTARQLAAWVARYLVPASVLENEFYVCVIAVATGAITAGAPKTINVITSEGFEVGGTVVIRNFLNSQQHETTVTAIPGPTQITVADSDTFSYSASLPPIIRYVLEKA